MQFMITAYDGTDEAALSRRRNIRPLHLENIRQVQEQGRFVCAGGIKNDSGSPIGSFLILEFESQEALDAYLSEEPYIVHQVWETVHVEACSVVILDDRFVEQ